MNASRRAIDVFEERAREAGLAPRVCWEVDRGDQGSVRLYQFAEGRLAVFVIYPDGGFADYHENPSNQIEDVLALVGA